MPSIASPGALLAVVLLTDNNRFSLAEQSITAGLMVGVLVGESEGDVNDRVRAVLDATGAGGDAQAWLAERRGRWIMGTPDEAWERVRALESFGAQRIMLQTFLPRDLDMVRLIGAIFSSG